MARVWYIKIIFQIHKPKSFCKELLVEFRDEKTSTAPPERRIFVSNLPYQMKFEDVKDFFRKNNCLVSCVEIFRDQYNNSNGCAMLEFNSNFEAEKAIEKMHGLECQGRAIVVKEDFIDNKRDQFGQLVKKKDR